MQRIHVQIQAPPALEDPLSFASAVTARLCHDVAGLLGTLAGTLELIDEEPEAAGLAADTAAALSARLRLLRTAWGGGGGAMDGAAIIALAQGLPGAERIRLDTTALPGILEEEAARLAMCLLLAAAPTLPRGTLVTLTGTPFGGFIIRLEGPNATWPAALAASPPLRPGQTQGALAASYAQLLAAQTGWQLDATGTSVTANPA